MNTKIKVERFKNGAFTPDLNGNLVSKKDRFGWKTSDAPGEFRMIEKHLLHVAPEYQRKKKSEAIVLEMARNWQWIKCAAICVADRSGKYFVVDGQHRKLAADKRSDITKLPCLVFPTETIAQEAQAFIDINRRRSRIGSVDMYRAQVVAGEQTAVFVSGILERCSLSVGLAGSTRTVACIGTLLKLAREDREKFSRLWPLFTHMHQDSEIFGDVISGAWAADSWLMQRNKSLSKDPEFSKLIRIGGKAALAEIKRLSIERGKGGQAVFRDAILALLRKKI